MQFIIDFITCNLLFGNTMELFTSIIMTLSRAMYNELRFDHESLGRYEGPFFDFLRGLILAQSCLQCRFPNIKDI